MSETERALRTALSHASHDLREQLAAYPLVVPDKEQLAAIAESTKEARAALDELRSLTDLSAAGLLVVGSAEAILSMVVDALAVLAAEADGARAA